MSEPPERTPDERQLASDLDERVAWELVESSPDGMVVVDERGIMLFVNRRLEALFGADRTQLTGNPIEMLLSDRDRAIHRAHRTRYRADPSVREMGAGRELRARRSDGTEFPVEVSLSPMDGSAGLRTVATVRDIADRVAQEADRRALLRALEAAGDAVFLFLVDTLKFTYVNNGALAQLGYSRDELLAMTPLHIKPEFTEQSFRGMMQPVLAGDVESQVFVTTHRRRDGGDVPVEVGLELAPRSGDDQPRLMMAIARDISDRLERQLAEASRKSSLALLAERERLAADLHDLVIQRLFGAGTGLQAVQALVKDDEVAERIDETVTEIDKAIAELRASIFRLTTPPGDGLRATIESVVADAAQWLGFEPTLSVVGDLGLIPDVAVEQLIPVLTETLSNVARHAEATVASVDVVVSFDRLVLTVVDNGKGIDSSTSFGNGLRNLEARARRVAGTASIGLAGDGTGTKVIWTARFLPDG